MPDHDVGFLDRLSAAANLTAGEQAVARYFEDHWPSSALAQLRQITEATGVSSATVARFARKLGYADFRDLSNAGRRETQARLDVPATRLRRLHERESPDTDARLLPTVRFEVAAADLGHTLSGIDLDAFARIAGLLADSHRPLYLGAVASGQPLLHYFALLLRYLRPNIVVLDGVDRWAHELAGLEPGAVVLGAAFDRYPVPVQSLLQFAQTKGATTVLLTNRRSSPLVSHANISLFVTSRAEPLFRSRVGLVVLLESLVDAVALRLGSNAERADDIETFFELMGGYLPPHE